MDEPRRHGLQTPAIGPSQLTFTRRFSPALSRQSVYSGQESRESEHGKSFRKEGKLFAAYHPRWPPRRPGPGHPRKKEGEGKTKGAAG